MDFQIRIDEEEIGNFIKGLTASNQAAGKEDAALGCSEDFAQYLRLAGINGDMHITEPEIFARVSFHITQFYVSSLLTAWAFLTRQIVDGNHQVKQITGPACRAFDRRRP